MMDDFNADNQKIDAALAGGAKIATGTYTGTGYYGAENPHNELTFPFAPKIVIIRSTAGAGYGATFLRSQTESVLDNCGSYSGYTNYLTWTDAGVSWYNLNRQDYQLNNNGATYYYLAIG